MRHQSWKLDIRLICRSQEDRRPRSFWGSSTAEVAILTFLHVGGKVRPNPAALAIDDALLLKLADGCLTALDSRSVMRVLHGLPISGLWKWNRLHTYSLARCACLRPISSMKLDQVSSRMN